MPDLQTIILDVDGTLVDSNDQHAHAWADAGRQLGIAIDYATVRCMIGMGGDQILPKLVGCTKASPEGQRFTHCVATIFRDHYLSQVKPFPHVRDLLLRMRQAGLELVVGSSARKDELEPLLEIAGIRDLIQHAICAAEVDKSKPSPEIIAQALAVAQTPADRALMLGDTPYDIEAARRAQVACIAVCCGGWRRTALAGADAVYQDPADLLAHFASSPLAR